MSSIVRDLNNLEIKKFTHKSKNKNYKKPYKRNSKKSSQFVAEVVDSIDKLGDYIRIEYDRSTQSIKLFRDWKCWAYKNYCKSNNIKFDNSDKVFIFNPESQFHKICENKDKLLKFESFIVEKFNLKEKNVRMSGQYLKMTENNALTLNLLTTDQMSEIRKKFVKKKGEDVTDVFGLTINDDFKFRIIEHIIKKLYGESVKIGHHLRVAIKNFSKWKHSVDNNDTMLLVILEEYPDGNKEVNIPGGKRELGESSLQAGIRETNEEVFSKFINCNDKPYFKFCCENMDSFVFKSSINTTEDQKVSSKDNILDEIKDNLLKLKI